MEECGAAIQVHLGLKGDRPTGEAYAIVPAPERTHYIIIIYCAGLCAAPKPGSYVTLPFQLEANDNPASIIG